MGCFIIYINNKKKPTIILIELAITASQEQSCPLILGLNGA